MKRRAGAGSRHAACNNADITIADIRRIGENKMAETGAEVMKENTRTQTQQPASGQAGQTSSGLKFPRYFTRTGISPYDEVEWELRTASITDAKGNTIFEQRNVESPKDWSMTAINIVASKYLHGTLGTPQRETGVRQLIQRVAETIRLGLAARLLCNRGRLRYVP